MLLINARTTVKAAPSGPLFLFKESEKQICFAVAPADKIVSQARCRNGAYGKEVAAELNWSGRRESNPHGQLGRLELYH